ncbi:MAG: DNA repair protein RecN, partial [Oscillospiraceae bacterium]
SILSPKTHINLIDEYGKTRSQIQEYQDKYNEVKTIEKQLIDLNTDETEKKKLLELYNFQINEISLAKLKVNEEDELEKRRDFLANAEKIISNDNHAYNNLYGDDEVTNAYDLLADSVRNLEMIAQFDDKLNNYHETLASVLMDLEDITHDLKSYIDIIDFDSKELDAVEERLSTIYNLRRKYGNTIEEILKYYETIAIEVENIENSDDLINVFTEKLECKISELFEASNNLTNSRIVAAKDLQEKIMKELADLDMQKMNFKVSVTNFLDTNKNIKYTSLGKDNVEFLISGNLGEELKPLYKIASGGEMSRIMLAIKSVLADMDVVETLIFDEIDTGVSGRAAQKIAEKIASLSKKRQVLSITHLAQIASMADTHYLIEKTDDAIKTSTSIVKLDENGRKYELARIIGGVKVTDLTLDNAKEMLDLATKFKKS